MVPRLTCIEVHSRMMSIISRLGSPSEWKRGQVRSSAEKHRRQRLSTAADCSILLRTLPTRHHTIPLRDYMIFPEPTDFRYALHYTQRTARPKKWPICDQKCTFFASHYIFLLVLFFFLHTPVEAAA